LRQSGNKKELLWKRLLDTFLFSSLFLALCAVGMVYQVYYLFNLPVDKAYLGFTFFGTLCSYNFHFYLTPSSYSGTDKTAWSMRNKNLHAALCLSGLIGAAILAWNLIAYWPWLVAIAFFTFLYSAPKIPHPAARWLQQIAVGKTLFLAFAWTHVTALLPFVLQETTFQDQHLFYILNRFFLIYGVCIVFDYRDRENDQQEGIRSMVTLLEPSGVHRYFWGILAAFILFSIYLQFLGLSWSNIAALILPGVLLGALFGYSQRNRSDYFFYLVLDGLMALSLPLLVLFGG
jgi:4-hydroxybenzoate polyprenyltransferase